MYLAPPSPRWSDLHATPVPCGRTAYCARATLVLALEIWTIIHCCKALDVSFPMALEPSRLDLCSSSYDEFSDRSLLHNVTTSSPPPRHCRQRHLTSCHRHRSPQHPQRSPFPLVVSAWPSPPNRHPCVLYVASLVVFPAAVLATPTS
ncbi:hypothetical protein PIB30_030610 [Stylosanthes scabra]|uniref:Uncharacterized protein n=1 Tax=Stylosanthes scabra TaxID=79078 RepID=A0ABU6WBB7_9FABA|nr:hypothetical protein [Stylosanthes scabra]